MPQTRDGSFSTDLFKCYQRSEQAFILSPTKFADLLNVGDPTAKTDLESHRVLFMEDGASA